MPKRYLNGMMFAGAIRHLENKYQLKRVGGSHWTSWYLGDTQIAGVCTSPYPGPEYGSWSWVDHDLTVGVEVVVQRSRPLNHTEAHFLNKRLDYQRRYNRPMPADQDVMQLAEVERAYDNILTTGGFGGRFGVGSFNIHWNEHVHLS